MTYRERLEKVIPGGSHTYSRGADQFPSNAPQILASGKGAYVFDVENRKYLDYGMGLRAVTCGYAEMEIDSPAMAALRLGNSLTRPSMLELSAAERFVDLIGNGVEMVKFTKTGSAAVTAAVKLARAYTGRELVLVCEQPFFSYDDWFIGTTARNRGIPGGDEYPLVLTFPYGDLRQLDEYIALCDGDAACLVMEAASAGCVPEPGFLEGVEERCHRAGIVFILDEMITGVRRDLRGAQHHYGIHPDLCTFGKAMANGYSVACLAGRRELMDLGASRDVFLLSTTNGAEMCGLAAFLATVDFYEQHYVVPLLWSYGDTLIVLANACAAEAGVGEQFHMGGSACSPTFTTLDSFGRPSLTFRTLFVQEMLKAGVLMPWVALSYRHGPAELDITQQALQKALSVYKRALEDGAERYLEGPVIRPVFP